jgi:hypothetical protein
MLYSVLNRATVRVANTRDVSGRVTAKSVKHGFYAKKQSDLSRICVLAIFGSVVLLAPVPTRAQGVPAEIAALKAQVAALQSQVQALQTQLAAVQSNNALKLGPFVTVDPNLENGVKGPNITFKGANIHIVSGHTTTADTVTGLGNLIIGYDEVPAVFGLPALKAGDRGGSHNLVIGRGNRFAQAAFGGLVAGEGNTISAEAASVSGGFSNTASSIVASVSGGAANTASGPVASVSGGFRNTASSIVASVSGGDANTASGPVASVSGGAANTASGVEASVSGGQFNTASGGSASVSGGFRNTASGVEASVSGGGSNTAGGSNTVVIGGQSVTDNKTFSIAPSPPFP